MGSEQGRSDFVEVRKLERARTMGKENVREGSKKEFTPPWLGLEDRQQ